MSSAENVTQNAKRNWSTLLTTAFENEVLCALPCYEPSSWKYLLSHM